MIEVKVSFAFLYAYCHLELYYRFPVNKGCVRVCLLTAEWKGRRGLRVRDQKRRGRTFEENFCYQKWVVKFRLIFPQQN